MSTSKTPTYSVGVDSSSDAHTRDETATHTRTFSLEKLRKEGVPQKATAVWRDAVSDLVPAELKPELQNVYLQLLSSVPRVELDEVRGLSIAKSDSFATELGFLVTPKVAKDGHLLVTCKVPVVKRGETHSCNELIKVSSASGKGEIRQDMGNYSKHLATNTHSQGIAIAMPLSARRGGSSSSSSSAASSSAASAGESAATLETRAMKDDMLRIYGLSTVQFYEALVEASTVDTRAVS